MDFSRGDQRRPYMNYEWKPFLAFFFPFFLHFFSPTFLLSFFPSFLLFFMPFFLPSFLSAYLRKAGRILLSFLLSFLSSSFFRFFRLHLFLQCLSSCLLLYSLYQSVFLRSWRIKFEISRKCHLGTGVLVSLLPRRKVR